MKTTLLTLSLAAFAWLAAAPAAEARHKHRGYSSHVYVSGYRSCGTPIYTERYVIRVKRCGTPVWGYRRVAAPRVYCPPPRPRRYVPAPCPPPPCYDGYRSGVVIRGTVRF